MSRYRGSGLPGPECELQPDLIVGGQASGAPIFGSALAQVVLAGGNPKIRIGNISDAIEAGVQPVLPTHGLGSPRERTAGDRRGDRRV